MNLREDILMHRIKQTTVSSKGHEDRKNHLAEAAQGLERYFSLLCFTAYVNESPDTKFEEKFSDWLRSRNEIYIMLQNIRRKGPTLYLFRPVDDLHRLRKSDDLSETRRRHALGFGPGMFEMIGAGGQLGSVAPELEEFILKVNSFNITMFMVFTR